VVVLSTTEGVVGRLGSVGLDGFWGFVFVLVFVLVLVLPPAFVLVLPLLFPFALVAGIVHTPLAKRTYPALQELHRFSPKFQLRHPTVDFTHNPFGPIIKLSAQRKQLPLTLWRQFSS
jgi:hypothetical protein